MKPNVAHEWNNIHKFVGSSFNYQPINKQLNKHSQALTTSGLGWRALYIPEILSAVRSKRIVQEWQSMMTLSCARTVVYPKQGSKYSTVFTDWTLNQNNHSMVFEMVNSTSFKTFGIKKIRVVSSEATQLGDSHKILVEIHLIYYLVDAN